MIIVKYLFVTFSGAGLARFYSENKWRWRVYAFYFGCSIHFFSLVSCVYSHSDEDRCEHIKLFKGLCWMTIGYWKYFIIGPWKSNGNVMDHLYTALQRWWFLFDSLFWYYGGGLTLEICEYITIFVSQLLCVGDSFYEEYIFNCFFPLWGINFIGSFPDGAVVFFCSTHLCCIYIFDEQKEATGCFLGTSYWCLHHWVREVHQIYGVFFLLTTLCVTIYVSKLLMTITLSLNCLLFLSILLLCR